METFDNSLQDVHNAIFHHKKKSAYLWRDKLTRFASNN
jgi:hypothetical protein